MSNESEPMREYRVLEQRLIALRKRTGGRYSSGEAEIANRMVEVWECLSEEEQDKIYSEGAKVAEAPVEEASPGRWGIVTQTIYFWSRNTRVRQYSRPLFIEHGAHAEQEPVCI